MSSDVRNEKKPFEMKFDPGTIKHLGLQMYSTLPSVLGELVANAWDADATEVAITIPEKIKDDTDAIVVEDNGVGMSDEVIRNKYLIIGRDRRADEDSDRTQTQSGLDRRIMGRKGIGKFSAFGVAKEIEIETVNNGEINRFIMDYDKLMENGHNREIRLPKEDPTGSVKKGTKITLRKITKYRTRPVQIGPTRRRLARRFAVIGAENKFEVRINGDPISVEDRDLKRLLAKDVNGEPYLWECDEEIESGTGWRVQGWIGALSRTDPVKDGIDRGIVIMARGKLVQEPFVFDAVVGQQYALSYLVGELHAEFVDEEEDTIATTRNTLVWDTEANKAFEEWGKKKMNKVAREWSDKRAEDNKRKLEENVVYREFRERAKEIRDGRRALKIADRLVRQAIANNPTAEADAFEPLIQRCIDFLEFDAFWEIAEEIEAAGLEDTAKILNLFREWEIVEAKEMMRVTEGRIKTIEKLQRLIETNALEVPTLRDFLKKFPWVIDPRWALIVDELYYSRLLREEFPENEDILETNKRIDFLCVSEGKTLVVVEIKRPKVKASVKELDQIEEYVNFVRAQIKKSNDPETYTDAIGYLVCGDIVKGNYKVDEKIPNLEKANIYIRRYGDMLSRVQRMHQKFLKRYEKLRKARERAQ